MSDKTKTIRSRKWFATIWNKQDYEKIKQLTYQYLIISADDRTQDGQLHWHAFI